MNLRDLAIVKEEVLTAIGRVFLSSNNLCGDLKEDFPSVL
jgi:hypothetical protein